MGFKWDRSLSVPVQGMEKSCAEVEARLHVDAIIEKEVVPQHDRKLTIRSSCNVRFTSSLRGREFQCRSGAAAKLAIERNRSAVQQHD